MALSAPVLAGLKPVGGSARLIVLRWLLQVAVALPGIAIGTGALGDALGRRPYFAEAPDPLPLLPLARFLAGVPGSVWGALAVGAVIGWLVSLMLTAAAVEILDPDRPPERIRVWRRISDTGRRFCFPYLRVALAALLAVVIGGGLIAATFERLSEHGRLAGWTGYTLAIQLPFAWTALVLAWASVVGVLAMWCRVILVADGRRRVRRLWPVVPRLWWRRVFSGLVFHCGLSVASLLLGGVTLFAWRQSPSSGVAWFVVWQGVLLLQAVLWHWRLRACRLVWAARSLDDLRNTADEPWHLFRRLRRRFRRQGADRVGLGSNPSGEQDAALGAWPD